MPQATISPVPVLRRHITELEAAIAVCLADPGVKAVHRLRTGTRRVEALLLLIDLVPGLPEQRKRATRFLHALKRLRRAAGTVRDLDVHRAMLEALAEPQTAALLSESAQELAQHMGRQREHAAAALQELLGKRQANTTRAAERLLEALQPAEALRLPAADLLRFADSILTRGRTLDATRTRRWSEDELHDARKAAKAARYVAEAAPGNPKLARAARRFEALQEAGGHWHDALELARAARKHLGKDHELTAMYCAARDRKLEAYREALLAEIQGATKPARRRAMTIAH